MNAPSRGLEPPAGARNRRKAILYPSHTSIFFGFSNKTINKSTHIAWSDKIDVHKDVWTDKVYTIAVLLKTEAHLCKTFILYILFWVSNKLIN